MTNPVTSGLLIVVIFVFTNVIAVEPEQEGTSSKPITYVMQIIPVDFDKAAKETINKNPPAEYPRDQWSTLRDRIKNTAREEQVTLEHSGFLGDSQGIEQFSVTKIYGSRAELVFGLWCFNKPMLILVVEDSKYYKAGEILVEGKGP